MKKCSNCGFSKDWKGSDIACPFKDKDSLFNDNWNCGIINKIRDICEKALYNKDDNLHYQFCGGQNYATINISNVGSDSLGLCLWVSWYKNRGATDFMWILSDDAVPRKPTLAELQQIIDHYLNIN